MIREALLIGINAYQNANQLQACVNDVLQMEFMLKSKGFRVHKLTDSDATKSAIVETWTEMCTRTRGNDASVLTFYFSGHGTRLAQTPEMNTWLASQVAGFVPDADGNADACVTYDATQQMNGRRLLFAAELRQLLQRRAGGTRCVGIFDCCFAGGLNPRAEANVRFVPASALNLHSPTRPAAAHGIARGRSLNGTVLYLACQADQESFEMPMQFASGRRWQGVQTEAILEASRKAVTYDGVEKVLEPIVLHHGFLQTPMMVVDPALMNRPFLGF